MSAEKTKYFTMRIPIELQRAIKAHCGGSGISMKEFCEKALRHYLVASCPNLSKIQDKIREDDIDITSKGHPLSKPIYLPERDSDED